MKREATKQYVRPLLLRIAEAPDPCARYDAMEAMLLLDDRSNNVLSILRDSIRRPEQEPPGLSEMQRLRFHDVDPIRARTLIDEFDLAGLIEELP